MDDKEFNVNEIAKRLYNSRSRIMTKYPFFGMIVLNLKFHLDEKDSTFSTDGEKIYFNPYFINKLEDKEIDICILHAVMHVVLKHPYRYSNNMDDQTFHLACDIVVNSNILSSFGEDVKELVIQGNVLPHLAPNGKEGYLYSVEEIYQQLEKKGFKKKKKDEPKADQIASDNEQIGLYNTVVSIKIKPSTDGMIYLKEASHSKYCGNHAWVIPDDYSKKCSINPVYYPSIKLMSLNVLPSSCDVEILANDCKGLAPWYPLLNNPIITGDTKVETINKKYTLDYLDYLIDKDTIKILKNIPLNKQLAQEEIAYRKYVYKTYLDVPKTFKNYFLNHLPEMNLDPLSDDFIFEAREYFAKNYKYSCNFPHPPHGQEEVLYFLEDSRCGVCRHFAAAYTLFLRTFNIPARITMGYRKDAVKGEVNDVYFEEGHAWCEVYIDGTGWIIVDPTPIIAQGGGGGKNNQSSSSDGESFDSHGRWQNNNGKDNQLKNDSLNHLILDAANLQERTKRGLLPNNVKIIINQLKEPVIDWRVQLIDFIQEDIVDYSFCPPDTRFQDSSFILPGFSEPNEFLKKILFMVDVSGSMSKPLIEECFSEIQGAINQFSSGIEGEIGFFDYEIQEVFKFDQDTNIVDLIPTGQGGTNFDAVFDYVKGLDEEDRPVTIIILTDGYAPYPDEEVSLGINVLWVINNKESNPPWGKIIRLIKAYY